MSNTIKATDTCLCGSVSVTANELQVDVGMCHCNICRKWGGGPHMSAICGANVTIQGEESISTYQSSDWAERGFCKKCGTHLYCKTTDTNEYYMTAGFFSKHEKNFSLEGQIFVDEQPKYYEIANKTDKMTGAEFFAMFAPEK